VIASLSLMRSLRPLAASFTRDTSLVAVCFLALLLLPKVASAGSCDNPITSACINSDTLWPHVGPSRFVAIGGTETIEQGKIGFGVLASYQSRPIVLTVPSPGPLGTNLNAVNDQVNATFMFEYGITKKLEIGVALPLTLGQGGSGTSGLTGGEDLRDTAVRDMRFGFAYSVLDKPKLDPTLAKKPHATDGLGLAVRFEMSAPTGDKDQFAGEQSAVFIPSLAADYRIGQLFFAGEAGARLRSTDEFVGARVGSQLAFALGAGFDILSRERLTVTGEARALPTLTEQHDAEQTVAGVTSNPNGRFITPAEWLLAVRSAPFRGGDFAGQIGGGGAIPFGGESAITTPRFRFILSIVFEPKGLDSDGDGVLDRDDQCPAVAGLRIGEKPGCPEAAAPPPPPEDFLAPPPPLPANAPAPPAPTPPNNAAPGPDSPVRAPTSR
jgi:hypothetical protein